MTSDDEAEKAEDTPATEEKNEKWVAVKGQATPAPAADADP